jgi:hypothetical protein
MDQQKFRKNLRRIKMVYDSIHVLPMVEEKGGAPRERSD